jgi:hypothetical protein
MIQKQRPTSLLALVFGEGRAASLIAGQWVPGIRFFVSEIDEMGTPIEEVAERLLHDSRTAPSASNSSEDAQLREASTTSDRSQGPTKKLKRTVNHASIRSATAEDYEKRKGWHITSGALHKMPTSDRGPKEDGSDDAA